MSPDSPRLMRRRVFSCGLPVPNFPVSVKRYNVRVHRAAANKLNIENLATRGSACNALLCRGFSQLSQSVGQFCLKFRDRWRVLPVDVFVEFRRSNQRGNLPNEFICRFRECKDSVVDYISNRVVVRPAISHCIVQLVRFVESPDIHRQFARGKRFGRFSIGDLVDAHAMELAWV